MKNIRSIFLKTCIGGTFLFFSVGCSNSTDWQLSPTKSDLAFTQLAATWDEGIPLGNATVGSLVTGFCFKNVAGPYRFVGFTSYR